MIAVQKINRWSNRVDLRLIADQIHLLHTPGGFVIENLTEQDIQLILDALREEKKEP